jgi:hypothetical protein
MKKCVLALTIVFVFAFCLDSQAGKRDHHQRRLISIRCEGISYHCDGRGRIDTYTNQAGVTKDFGRIRQDMSVSARRATIEARRAERRRSKRGYFVILPKQIPAPVPGHWDGMVPLSETSFPEIIAPEAQTTQPSGQNFTAGMFPDILFSLPSFDRPEGQK